MEAGDTDHIAEAIAAEPAEVGDDELVVCANLKLMSKQSGTKPLVVGGAPSDG